MKKFIGRKTELQVLEKLIHKSGSSVLVTGSPGVGKTALVRYISNGYPTLYFSARQETQQLFQRRLQSEVFSFCGHPSLPDGKVMSWKKIFETFATYQTSKRKLFIIDDFDLLLYENPNFEKELQRALKQCFKPADVMVILIMNKGKAFADLKKQRHGLLRDLTQTIHLKPFTFTEMIQEYPFRHFSQLVMLYAIAGGMPAYWEYFKDCEKRDDFLGSVRSQCLNPQAFLFDEPQRRLASEFWNPGLYSAILQSLAASPYQEQKIPEIAKYLNEKTSKIEKAVTILHFLGILELNHDILNKKPLPLKKQTCSFSQPFYAFWYNFVEPAHPVLEAGKDLPVFENIKRDFDAYLKGWYQKISGEILNAACRQPAFPFKLDRVSHLNTRDGDQLDLIAVDEDNQRIFMAECVFEGRPYSLDAFEAFKETCDELKALRSFKDYKRLYGVFATGGFEEDLMDYCMITQGVILFNGITVYSALQS